jgi:hypothetical protein
MTLSWPNGTSWSYASYPALRPCPQDSELAWLARPSPYDSFIRYISPVGLQHRGLPCALVLPSVVRCLRTGLTLRHVTPEWVLQSAGQCRRRTCRQRSRSATSWRSLTLARRCTALEKLPRVNFLILRELENSPDAIVQTEVGVTNDAGATHAICRGQSYREGIRRDRKAGRIARPEGGRVVSGNPAGEGEQSGAEGPPPIPPAPARCRSWRSWWRCGQSCSTCCSS